MPIKERIVETFEVVDARGKSYVVHRIEQIIEHDGRPHVPAFRLALEGGGAVSELEDGRVRIAGIPSTMVRAARKPPTEDSQDSPSS